MTSMIYHGPSREKVSARQLAKYDIVITTYGTVQTEISKVIPEPEGKKSNRLDDLKPINLDDVDTKKAALLNIVWERIILDEAHQIRNPLGKWYYKGQLNYQDFSPESLLEGREETLVIFGWHFGRNDDLINSFWI